MVTEGFSPNLATYKMLVNAYSKGKRKDEAWRLIEELVQKGMMPDSVRKKNVLRLKSLDRVKKSQKSLSHIKGSQTIIRDNSGCSCNVHENIS